MHNMSLKKRKEKEAEKIFKEIMAGPVTPICRQRLGQSG
jgi:hypothetical protein